MPSSAGGVARRRPREAEHDPDPRTDLALYEPSVQIECEVGPIRRRVRAGKARLHAHHPAVARGAAFDPELVLPKDLAGVDDVNLSPTENHRLDLRSGSESEQRPLAREKRKHCPDADEPGWLNGREWGKEPCGHIEAKAALTVQGGNDPIDRDAPFAVYEFGAARSKHCLKPIVHDLRMACHRVD